MPGYIGRAEIQVAGGAISRNVFVGNGATTSFGPLDQTPFNEEETIVTINGVVQHDASYAVVVDYVNFGNAPDNLDEIEVKVHSTERKPAEGVSTANIDPEAVTLSKLSTIDVMTSNDRFSRAIIPSKRRYTYGADLQYDTTNRNFWENICIEFSITNKTLTLGTAVEGDELEAVIIGNNTFNLTYDTGTVVVFIDAVGSKTTLTGPKVISGDDILKIKYMAPDYVIVESSNVEKTLNGAKGWMPMGAGMIMQWGYVAHGGVPGGGSLAQTYERPFPNAVVSVVSTGIGTVQGGGTDDFWLVWAQNLTGFTIYNGYNSAKGANWIAIGY